MPTGKVAPAEGKEINTFLREKGRLPGTHTPTPHGNTATRQHGNMLHKMDTRWTLATVELPQGSWPRPRRGGHGGSSPWRVPRHVEEEDAQRGRPTRTPKEEEDAQPNVLEGIHPPPTRARAKSQVKSLSLLEERKIGLPGPKFPSQWGGALSALSQWGGAIFFRI